LAHQPHGLSKSRFVSGLQCHRLLWWLTHEPDSPELVPGPGLQAIFDQGTEVGELARTYVPGGHLVDAPWERYEERVALTARALEAGERVLYEASFVADRVFVAADILERNERKERNDGGWTLIEVKSTTSVKDQHVADAALQTHVLRAAGVNVTRVELMHLNRACVAPDLSNLFSRADLTALVEAALPGIPARVREMLAMLEGKLPEVAIGQHCTSPYECAFRSRCWANLPAHHVTHIYYAGRKAWSWIADGYETLLELPDSVALTPPAERQRRAVREGRRIVEPGLAEALAAFEEPLAVLDFETVNPAVPHWPGCSPYTQVPVQFSVQRRRGGEWSESGWIAPRGEDPRPECADAVLAACEGAATVLAYNVGFERGCLAHLALAAPARAAELRELSDRLADLLPVVREHVYDPAFDGSFSLKAVLPALVAGDGYAALDIAEGSSASRELGRLLLATGAPDAETEARTRAALLAYCAQDTRAVVDLLGVLAGLAPTE
jgi:hypothetical protein